MKKEAIAVYCGANNGNDKSYKEGAIELGTWIGNSGFRLVYGGGNIGLMGVVSRATREAGGKDIGIMPEFLMDREIAKDSGDIEIVKDMPERKQRMIDLADIYIALPGGVGTLEEIIEVISLSSMGRHKKPCIFYNINDYYSHLERFLEVMVVEGFFDREIKESILFASSIKEIEDFIKDYKAPEKRKYK